MAFKGWIALDIDGTVTLDKYTIPKEVVDFLRLQTEQGWRIAMAKGRPTVFASIALSSLDFPYLFIAQNGSLALEMPGKRELMTRYIPRESLEKVERCLEGFSGDMLIYSGYKNNDAVYYRPHRFDAEQTRYLTAYWERQKERPIAIEELSEIAVSSIPLIKCFGRKEEMKRLHLRVQEHPEFNAALLRDPFVEEYFILLITDQLASKGKTLEAAMKELDALGGILIAAGDDENDASLLEIADVAIAMEHAPSQLLEMADLIAPPTKDLGIIHALRMAMGDL